MSDDALRSPLAFFESVLGPYAPLDPGIRAYAAQWAADNGQPADSVAQQQERWSRGYAAGIIQRVHKQESLLPSAAMLYITAFYAPHIATTYIDSLLVRHIVDKYAPDAVHADLLPRLQNTYEPWRGDCLIGEQGLTATQDDAGWRLNGLLPLAPGIPGSSVSLVYAGSLFLVSHRELDGTGNFIVRQPDNLVIELQDSPVWQMGTPEETGALLTELRTLWAALESIAHVGRRQREQPPDDVNLRPALALAWAAMQVGDDTAREVAGLYSDSYQRFRLLARLARNYGFPRPIVPVEDGFTDDSEVAQALLADLSEYLSPELDAAPLAERVAQAYLRRFESAISLLR